MGRRVPLARLHRWILRLHPRSFRRRFGDSAHRLFLEWVQAADSPRQGLRRARRGILEATGTCLSAWGGVLSGPLGGAGRALGMVVRVSREGALAALRSARRRPHRSVVVIATLAVAVGLNASLLTVAHGVLMGDLPYERPDRVALLEGRPLVRWEAGELRIREVLTTLPGLESVAAYTNVASANLTGASETTRVRLAQVSTDFFDTLGVRMPLGRGFTASDSGSDVAVIGHRLWVQAFGADPGALGRELRLNGAPYSIIGIAPPGVRFPDEAETWLSMPVRPEFFGNAMGGHVLARLARGESAATVESLLLERYEPIRREDAAAGSEMPPPSLLPLRDHLVADARLPLLALVGAALVVLLLGGLNLVGIWVNEVLERLDELRLRRALGASGGRIYAQLVAETVATALVGGLGALLLATITIDLVSARFPGLGAATDGISIGAGTVAVALGLAALIGLTFGGLAAAIGTRIETGSARRGADTPGVRRLQAGLVVAQGALALVLVVGAGLMGRSFQALATTPLGFEPEGTLSFQVRIPEAEAASTDALRAYVRELRDRLRALPGVLAVGLTDLPPLSFEMGYTMRLRRPEQPAEEATYALAMRASPEYFEAAGIPVIQGRTFATDDEGEPGILLDERVAGVLFPDEVPTNRSIEALQYVDGDWSWQSIRVRGVVGSVRAHGVRSEAYPTVYESLSRAPSRSLGVILRATGNPAGLADAARAAALRTNPAVAPYRLRSLRSAADDLIATDRALAFVGSGFSLAALALAALGLYGLIGQTVARRQRELGVRLALGALPAALIRRTVRHGLALGLAALLLGIPAAVVAARALRSRLYGVEPVDPFTLALGSAFLLAVCMLAAWIPARRIAEVDPREALAAE